jgi:hypothetical protein
MKIGAFCVLSIVAAAPSCSRTEGVAGTYSGAAFLTVSATPIPGTTATAVRDMVCAGTMRIESDADGRLRGAFDRTACTGLVNPTGDVHGTVAGTVLDDGTVSLTFTEAPLASSLALTTSGGCPPADEAMGPFTGRITSSSLSVTSRFRQYCAGLPFPAPPAFEVLYRVEAARESPRS